MKSKPAHPKTRQSANLAHTLNFSAKENTEGALKQEEAESPQLNFLKESNFPQVKSNGEPALLVGKF